MHAAKVYAVSTYKNRKLQVKLFLTWDEVYSYLRVAFASDFVGARRKRWTDTLYCGWNRGSYESLDLALIGISDKERVNLVTKYGGEAIAIERKYLPVEVNLSFRAT